MSAETHVANNTNTDITVQVNEIGYQEFFTALFQNSTNDNHGELHGYVHRMIQINHANSLKNENFLASLEELLDEALCIHGKGACFTGAREILLYFFDDRGTIHSEQLPMWEKLQPLERAAVGELRGVRYLKKASAFFFTAAAAGTAAVAAANASLKMPALAAVAAAASVVLGAVGRWANSVLKKRESAVKKRKEIIRVMIMAAKTAINDLSKIYELARRLQCDMDSVSELMADGGGADDVSNKMAELGKSFRDLRSKVNDYCGSMRRVEQMLQRIYMN